MGDCMVCGKPQTLCPGDDALVKGRTASAPNLSIEALDRELDQHGR
jgi:hypothetical protein